MYSVSFPFKMAAHGDTHKHGSQAASGWWALHLIHTGLEFSTPWISSQEHFLVTWDGWEKATPPIQKEMWVCICFTGCLSIWMSDAIIKHFTEHPAWYLQTALHQQRPSRTAAMAAAAAPVWEKAESDLMGPGKSGPLASFLRQIFIKPLFLLDSGGWLLWRK